MPKAHFDILGNTLLEVCESFEPRIAGDMNAGSSDERGENNRVIVCVIN